MSLLLSTSYSDLWQPGPDLMKEIVDWLNLLLKRILQNYYFSWIFVSPYTNEEHFKRW